MNPARILAFSAWQDRAKMTETPALRAKVEKVVSARGRHKRVRYVDKSVES